MAVDIQWDSKPEEYKCILITYTNPWTWEEFDAVYEAMISMLNDAGVDKRITLIIDIRAGGFPPSDALPRFRRVVEMKHPNVTQIIFVAPGALAHFVRISMNILKRVYRTVGKAKPPEFQFVASLEEARELNQTVSSTATSP